MSNHDDFVDDYIEYRIFEESMKRYQAAASRPNVTADAAAVAHG